MDYQGNSNKNKPKAPVEEKNIEKVVEGPVVLKERGFGQKFKDVFFGGDFKTAIRYIAADVLLPAVRNLMVDATTKGVERMVYGESERRRGRMLGGYGGYSSRIQYNSPVRRDRAYLPDQPSSRVVREVRRDTNQIVLSTREEAELVLERMNDILDKYQVVSVADLHELTGLPSSHVDNKWGWTLLNTTEIRQIREGYLLDLPPTEEID